MAFLNKYGVARHIYVPVIKRAVVDFAVSADWTPAAGDVKISKDGGAAANVTNLPTAITMGNTAMWDFSITATELQAAQVLVTVADSATKAVEDTMFIVETYGNASGQHPFDLATATQKVDVDTIKTNPVVNGGTITFPTTATLASTTNITAGTVTTATNVTTVNGLAAAVITAASIAASALNGKGDWNIGKTGYALSAAGVQAIWDALTSALTTATSIGKLLVDNINATISSRLATAGYTAPLDAAGTRTAVGLASANLDTQLTGINTNIDAVDTEIAAVDVEVAAIKAKTDNLPEGIKKNTALSNFEFVMLDSSDHVTAKTGLTITATRSIDGAAFGACANSASEIGTTGVYKIDLAAADLNGTVVTLKFAATGADATHITIKTTL